jgi:hypothetical protein
MVFERDKERSFGVIRLGSATHQVRLGGTVEGGTLVTLAPTYGYLRGDNGMSCRLPLFTQATPAPPPAAAPPPEPAKEPAAKGKKERKPLFSTAELEAGITPLGGDRYRVSRELLTRALADGAGVVRGAKFFPQTGGARHAGVKVTGVPETSVLHKLGVRSNDVLRTLNGVDLPSPDGMLGAYALLKEQGTITLSVTRGGRAKNLQYEFE